MYAYYYVRLLLRTLTALQTAHGHGPAPHPPTPSFEGKICMTKILHDQEFVRSCVNSRICSPSSFLWADLVHPVIVS